MFNNDAVTTSRPRISCSFRAFETKKTEKNALIALQCLSVCNNSRKTEQGFAEFVILHQSLYAIMYIKPTNMSVEQTFCRTYTGTKSVTHWHNVSHKMALRQSHTGTTSVTRRQWQQLLTAHVKTHDCSASDWTGNCTNKAQGINLGKYTD